MENYDKALSNAICFNCKNTLSELEKLRIKKSLWQNNIKIDSFDFKYNLMCRNCEQVEEHYNR